MVIYSAVKHNRREFLALTGLTHKEFKDLLSAFIESYRKKYAGNKTLKGQKRQRQVGGGRTGKLGSPEQKLLFILIYLKTYPLQVIMGQMFDMTQAGVNQWIQRLLPILQSALDLLGVKPEREGRQFSKSERGRPETKEYIIDGVERRRQRPKKPEKQALHYSGKKKAHTDKNIVIASRKSKRVGYLGPTEVGKTHDKKLADRADIAYPRQSILYKDTAFQGYEPKVKQTHQPKKNHAVKSCAHRINDTIERYRVFAFELNILFLESNALVV